MSGMAPRGELLLQVRGLSKRFSGITAVDDVSFDVREGEVFTLIGPNGAGKTTVFNIISRIYEPSAGHIDYGSATQPLRLTGLPAHRTAELGIARTFQNIELFENASVLQNLLIGRHARRRTGPWADFFFTPLARRAEIEAREAVEDVIDFLELARYRDVRVAALPYGVRKVVELGRALCAEPRLLLLDEPSSGLNVEETQDMAFWIHDIRDRRGITVLMVEHDMGLVSQVSDTVLAMDHGAALALGTPATVQADPRVIEAYLGAAAMPAASEA